jgi:hypothetical protein
MHEDKSETGQPRFPGMFRHLFRLCARLSGRRCAPESAGHRENALQNFSCAPPAREKQPPFSVRQVCADGETACTQAVIRQDFPG